MKSYEDLLGAKGRRVFYRAERLSARQLFPQHVPAIRIENDRFDLENLSITGLAVRGNFPSIAGLGPESDVDIVFEMENAPLLKGRARIRRIEELGAMGRIGLSFTGAPLDVGLLVRRHGEVLLRRELNGGLNHGIDLVDPAYRRHCADALHLLRRYRTTLRNFEGISKRDGEPPDQDRLEDLYYLCEERILPEWRDLLIDGNALTRPLFGDPERLLPAKKFTEQILTPEFMAGPIWNRSYRKPLGYPGDFEIMNFIYDWKPVGATVYERLVHRIGLDAMECVATRMMMVRDAIADVVASTPVGQGPARILSLGSGTAQEVQNYLDTRRLPRAIDVTLVDQDERALGEAYEKCYRKMMGHDNGSRLTCLQTSFVELLRADRTFAALPPQDLIYSVGLVDYLTMPRIQALVASLYRMLAPGGRLVIANISDVPDSGYWASEMICDWSMYFRTKSQMGDMAARVPEAAISIDTDSTGRIYVLTMQKPKEFPL